MLRFFLILLQLVVCFLFQSSVFPGFTLAGVVPDLMLILIITVAYTKGSVAGMFTGFAAGLLTDACFSEVFGLCALLYLFIGFVAGYAEKVYDEKDYILPMLMIVAGEFLYSFALYVVLFLLRSRTAFGYYFIHLVLPRMVYTVLAAAFLFPFFLFIHKLLSRFEQRED